MSSEDWTVVVDSKKEKYIKKRDEIKKYPHLIRANQAQNLERNLNIANFANTLLSEKAVNLQYEGWIYTRALRPNDTYEHEFGWEYTTLDNFNKWGDRLLFRRKLQSE